MAKQKEKPIQTELDRAEDRVRKRTAANLTSATPERLAKAGSEGYEHTQTNVQRIVSAPLDRLYKSGLITKREYSAGDRYREDVYLAKVDPSAPSVDWNATGTAYGPKTPAMFSAQKIADARIRTRAVEKVFSQRSAVRTLLDLGLLKEMNFEDMGAALFPLQDRRELTVAARAGFRVALSALADYYENQGVRVKP